MTNKFYTIGFVSILPFTAACASGGTTGTSEGRTKAHLGDTATDDLIPRRICTSTNTSAAPSNGLIADFSAKPDDRSGAISGGIPGKVFTSVPRDSVPGSAITHATEADKLTIRVHGVPGAKPQFLTATMLFDNCVDASGFAGVEFNISGSLSGCSLMYSSVDPEHQYYRVGGPYPPQKRISPDDLTSHPQKIVAPFRDSDIQGNPATPTDPSKLAFINWMVIVPVGSHDGSAVPPCDGSIVIDEVKLYR